VLGITGSADRKGDPITPTNAASVEQFGTPLTFPDKVTSLTLTSKGEMFAAGLFSGKIGVWQLSNPADIHWLQAPLNVVNSINFSPDGQLLAAASGQGSIPVWRVSDWAPLPSLTGIAPGLGFTSVRFSPDGEILAAGAADKTIRLWRLP
jgi:WD40 repeat protein